MLNTTDLVKVADTTPEGKKAGLIKYHGTFTRPYLSRSSDDKLESETVKFKTVDNGEVSVEITYPEVQKDDKGKRLALQTKADPTQLLKDAIEYYKTTQENEVQNPQDRVNPVLLLLSDADDGLVSRLRMKRRNELIPAEIDADKALLKQATVMHNSNRAKFPTIEAAVEALKALMA